MQCNATHCAATQHRTKHNPGPVVVSWCLVYHVGAFAFVCVRVRTHPRCLDSAFVFVVVHHSVLPVTLSLCSHMPVHADETQVMSLPTGPCHLLWHVGPPGGTHCSIGESTWLCGHVCQGVLGAEWEPPCCPVPMCMQVWQYLGKSVLICTVVLHACQNVPLCQCLCLTCFGCTFVRACAPVPLHGHVRVCSMPGCACVTPCQAVLLYVPACQGMLFVLLHVHFVQPSVQTCPCVPRHVSPCNCVQACLMCVALCPHIFHAHWSTSWHSPCQSGHVAPCPGVSVNVAPCPMPPGLLHAHRSMLLSIQACSMCVSTCPCGGGSPPQAPPLP